MPSSVAVLACLATQQYHLGDTKQVHRCDETSCWQTLCVALSPMTPQHVGDPPLVLVMEDECDMRGLLAALLRAQVGCAVHAASNSEEALAFVRTSEEPLPRLIVLDWMMPQMKWRHDAGMLKRAIRRWRRSPS